MNTVCKIESCGKDSVGRGWCGGHYVRFRKYGDPLAGQASRIRIHVCCTVIGCGKPHFGRGFCSAHYTRNRRGKDLLAQSDKQRAREAPMDEIVRLYTVDKLSTIDIGKRFNLADVTVSAMLKKRGISLRGIRGPRMNIRGSNHHSWKSDRQQLKLTKLQSRPVFETRAWRLVVMTRDDFECQSCGASDYLEAHHIESWGTCPEKRFDPFNGVTFCKPCHVAFHKRFGRRNNNRVQLAQFIAPAMEIAA